MEDEYDCVILGTGLKECVLSGILSVQGLKVLHMDRNNFYGGDSASLNLAQLFEKFYPNEKVPEELGHNRYWNVDLIPKFLLSSGKLVKMLLLTGVTRYLEFRAIDSSWVLKGSKVHPVPSNDTEAVKSSLMGFFEKRRAQKFFLYLQGVDEDDESTWGGINIKKVPMAEVFKEYSLEDDTIDFIGHAMALYRDDAYLEEPALECINRIRLYVNSMGRYGKGSPYIYPAYGLGELPQAFARLSAIYGGVYMLDRSIDEIVYDDEGKAVGVKSEGEVAKCRFVIGDPSYFSDKVEKTGQVVRCICFLTHPVPNTSETASLQLIIPQKQVGRNYDIYISVVSAEHQVANKGYWIALVSTTVETDDPESELEPGFNLLGDIAYKFFSVSDTYKPTNADADDNCFISESFDATTHFESTCDDILQLYEKVMGKPLELDSELLEKKQEEEGM